MILKVVIFGQRFAAVHCSGVLAHRTSHLGALEVSGDWGLKHRHRVRQVIALQASTSPYRQRAATKIGNQCTATKFASLVGYYTGACRLG